MKTKSPYKILLVTMTLLSTINCDDLEDGNPAPKNNLVNLKHRRYKPIRDNTTGTEERLSSEPSIIHHDHVHVLPDPHFKSSRGGFELQKSPPDLQFGLAFTVPFVSLSTEKLIHGVASGKGFDHQNSASSLLKLNFSGLFLAAIVGIVAIAGLLLPSVFGGGGLGGLVGPNGWGNGILDGILPNQFTENLYNDYENGWGGSGGGNKNWGKEFGGRRGGRKYDFITALGNGAKKMLDSVKSRIGDVGECALEKVCGEVASGNGGESPILSVINEFKDSPVWEGLGGYSRSFEVIREVAAGEDNGECGKVGGGFCEGLSDVGELLRGVVGRFGGGGGE